MEGCFKRLLRIDLNERSFKTEALDDGIYERYLGGKGIATHILLSETPDGVAPFSPENLLIFALGPFSGTPVWGSCRYGVYTKSPQTGFYSEAYSGGTVADYMAKTGFDAFIIKGKANNPVWLEVSEEGAVFHDGKGLWGKDCIETERAIKQEIKNLRPMEKNCGVVVIGPAGENLVTFSVIENDLWRSAGRTGVGAVMGSKGLKGIAFRGGASKRTAFPDQLSSFVKEFAQKAKDDKGVNAYKSMGTSMMVDIMSQVGSFPTRYWHKGQAEHRESINAGALHSRLEVSPHACLKCFIGCGRRSKIKEGPYAGLELEGPEYETIYAFGGLCEIKTIEEIAFLNDICDRLGMDTISAGNLVAFAMEASSLGRIDYEIKYGDTAKTADLLNKIAFKRDLGATLAKGIRHAAKQWGMEDVAIHVKGLEPAGYDPRVLKGMGLAYGSSPRGACHLRATFYKPELAGMIPPEQIEGKAAMFAEWEDRLIIFDSMVLCRFFRDLYQWDVLSEAIRLVTGLRLDKGAMREIAGRILDETRLFNIKEGLKASDDRLPSRFHTEALPETGKTISPESVEILLKEYYKERGWDELGRPRQI
jgi:aldehyde:ferredoxin oxidoreductase